MSEDMIFANCVAAERERLTTQKNAIAVEIAGLQSQAENIKRELTALDAYEAAKTGKATMPSATGKTRRPRNGTRREELLNIIGQNNGLSRGEILERMGLKGDKSGEMAVSNALTAMGKRNEVRREGGKYYAVEALQEAA